MFSAKIIADSLSEHGHRLTTFIVTFPRYILAEFNTHRMFSRNSASSRAIPFHKIMESVEKNPFVPIAWQKHHSGMQGTEYFTDPQEIIRINNNWKDSRYIAIQRAEMLHDLGVTKQICNRELEPYMWHTAIVTATEYENFFALRCPQYWFEPEDKLFRSTKDLTKYWQDSIGTDEPLSFTQLQWLSINKGGAEIHIMKLAEMMWDAMNEHKPSILEPGEWHIPFGDQINSTSLLDYMQPTTSADENHHRLMALKMKIATTRCAQISYVIADAEDKPMNYEKMLSRHDKLADDGHWSPFEHPGSMMTTSEYYNWSKSIIVPYEDLENYKATHLSGTYSIIRDIPDGVVVEEYGWCGNFRGFIQYRKLFLNENIVSKKTI